MKLIAKGAPITMAIAFAVAVPIAKADIVHVYIKLSCNHDQSEAVITHSMNWNDDPAPPNSILLEDLPRFHYPSDPGRGAALCNRGPLKDVSVKGQIDEDHPRNDGLVVYVNGVNQSRHPISLNSGYTSYSDQIIIRRRKGGIIEMSECVSGKPCRQSVLNDH